MRTISFLFFCHCGALLLGLVGLLIMLPHPEIWNGTPEGVTIFRMNMTSTGSLYILLGTATMLLFGLRFVGVRNTLIFFGASTLISLSIELLGTSTGFPFGPYSYTDLLGYKLFGHVPYVIPLSWFYMGFTTYLLASMFIARTGWRYKTLWSLLLGAFFLTVWDLSLDPAMASPHLPVQFWIWHQTGPYFGMPVRNLIGWSATGLAYMSVSRLCWQRNLEVKHSATWLPFGVYTANICFASILTLGAGMWQPSLLALLLGILPATFALWPHPRDPDQPGRNNVRILEYISHLIVRQGGSIIAQKRLISKVSGQENLPQEGPMLIIARHFHHLYDGCLLLHVIPRYVHVLVALDWVEHSLVRRLMEILCRTVSWPVVLRDERLSMAQSGGTPSAYQRNEVLIYLRRATTLIVQLLRQGEALVIFPEAYPAIDPLPSPRSEATTFLPFRRGFARWLEMAESNGQIRVAVVPAGLEYVQDGHWQVTLRFGPALWRKDFTSTTQFIQVVEERVHALSTTEPTTIPTQIRGGK